MLTGELRRKPIWTAFITRQIHIPGWVSRDSKRVVLLADLERFIFTDEYSPQRTSTGESELTFILSSGTTLVYLVVLGYMLIGSDADDFIHNIEDLKDHLERHQAGNVDESDDDGAGLDTAPLKDSQSIQS